jgi:hypothetical protein
VTPGTLLAGVPARVTHFGGALGASLSLCHVAVDGAPVQPVVLQ